MSEVKQEQGNLSINSENLFPIIKKWLYSDHDIFFRELISNGCDAVTKVQKLEVMGEYQLQEGEKFRVDVIVNPEEKTLKFIDNGIGMTADEVKEYITQIAFSGATDFLEKYKDKTNEDQIIGHFGLGFYSAFMVADKVTIDTLSYQEGAEPVFWECDGDSEYSMSEGSRTTRGTEITLYLNEDSYEFSNEYRAREVITKYCSFMPVEIYLSKEGGEQEYQTIEKDELREDDVIAETIVEDEKTEEKENENGEKDFYRYDLTEKTLQRYFRDPASGTASDGQGATVDEYNSLLKDYNMRFWIIIGLIALAVILLIAIIVLIATRGPKDDFYERREDGDDYPHKAAKEKREKASRRLSREEKYLTDLEEEEDEYQGDELDHDESAVETDQQAYRRPEVRQERQQPAQGRSRQRTMTQPTQNTRTERPVSASQNSMSDTRYMEPVKRTQKPAPAPAAKPENQDDDLEFVDLDL